MPFIRKGEFKMTPSTKNKILFVFAAVLFGGPIFAAETVTELDFTKEFELKKLFVHGKELPIPAYTGNFVLEKEAGGQFFRFKNIIWKLGAKLKTPIEVGDKTLSVEIYSEMRQKPKKQVYFTLVLTSKELPDLEGNAAPFRKGLDSGFEAGGYDAGDQAANRILWRKDGMDYLYEAPKPPFNFVSKEGNAGSWIAWRLVYSHPEKTLSLFIEEEKEPRVVQRNVDLTGITLNSLYFGAWSIETWGDFRKVTVKVTEK